MKKHRLNSIQLLTTTFLIAFLSLLSLPLHATQISIHSGQTVTGATLGIGDTMLVYANGVAEDTTINGGYARVYDNGQMISTVLNGGNIVIEDTYDYNNCTIMAVDTIINSGGNMLVKFDSHIEDTIVNAGGELYLYDLVYSLGYLKINGGKLFSWSPPLALAGAEELFLQGNAIIEDLSITSNYIEISNMGNCISNTMPEEDCLQLDTFEINFNMTDLNTPNQIAMLNDLSCLHENIAIRNMDFDNVRITIDAANMADGQYIIGGNAGNFSYRVILYDETTIAGTFTWSSNQYNTISYGGDTYSLSHVTINGDDCVVLTKS